MAEITFTKEEAALLGEGITIARINSSKDDSFLLLAVKAHNEDGSEMDGRSLQAQMASMFDEYARSEEAAREAQAGRRASAYTWSDIIFLPSWLLEKYGIVPVTAMLHMEGTSLEQVLYKNEGSSTCQCDSDTCKWNLHGRCRLQWVRIRDGRCSDFAKKERGKDQ